METEERLHDLRWGVEGTSGSARGRKEGLYYLVDRLIVEVQEVRQHCNHLVRVVGPLGDGSGGGGGDGGGDGGDGQSISAGLAPLPDRSEIEARLEARVEERLSKKIVDKVRRWYSLSLATVY